MIAEILPAANKVFLSISYPLELGTLEIDVDGEVIFVATMRSVFVFDNEVIRLVVVEGQFSLLLQCTLAINYFDLVVLMTSVYAEVMIEAFSNRLLKRLTGGAVTRIDDRDFVSIWYAIVIAIWNGIVVAIWDCRATVAITAFDNSSEEAIKCDTTLHLVVREALARVVMPDCESDRFNSRPNYNREIVWDEVFCTPLNLDVHAK
jgi:hypothetical protein